MTWKPQIPAEQYDKDGYAVTLESKGSPSWVHAKGHQGEMNKPAFEHGQIRFSKRIERLPV